MAGDFHDLHRLHIRADVSGEGEKGLEDYSLADARPDRVDVYFRQIEARLIEHIDGADIVVGCVAWLTSAPVLTALSRKVGVAIVVQKEDFLRPDVSDRPGTRWATDLRDRYNRLPSTLERGEFWGTRLSELSVCCDPTIDPVRCVGNMNRGGGTAPRSHHKFVVFCKYIRPDTKHCSYTDIKILPYAVWTGSFNFTVNATRSFENAVVLTGKKVATAYLQEWAQIEALSEPLDWTCEYSEPEWRIGT